MELQEGRAERGVPAHPAVSEGEAHRKGKMFLWLSLCLQDWLCDRAPVCSVLPAAQGFW